MTALIRRLKSLLPWYQRAQDEEIQEELAALEQFASRRELGNLTRAAEEARAVLGFPLIQGVGADIRYAWRSLKRDRAFTIVALLSLSIGVGANVAVFGLIDALLWRQLPIRSPEQLVSFENTSRSYFGYSEFANLSSKALQNVIAESSIRAVPVAAGSGAAVNRQVEFVSGDYFRALSVTPEIGRPIRRFDDDLNHPALAAMLSYSYWSRAFGRRPDVVGKSLYIGKAKFQIAGVAPQDFFGLRVGEAPEVWLPLATYPMVFPGTGKAWLSGKNNNWLDIFGRLQNGISVSKAQAMLSAISVEIDIERNGASPTEIERRAMLKDSIRLVPAMKGISELRERFSTPLHVVFGMLAIGLSLACINIINLQIARSDESRKEFAIRLAIGAGRFRVARQCLIEMLALSVVSECLALLLFKPIATGVVSIMTVGENTPAQLDLKVDHNLLTFMLLSSIGIAVLCGLLPAVYATRQSLRAGLQSGSPFIAGRRSPTSLIRTVGVVQIAVSLVMITATCLFALNLGDLRRFDGGVKRDGLLEVEIDASAAGYGESRAVLLDERLGSRFASILGIEHVTYSADGIYSGRDFTSSFEVDGKASSLAEGDRYGVYDYVGPNFFTTLGTTILAGRDFTNRDTAPAAPVVIINQALATRFFPEQGPIGRNLYVSEAKGKKSIPNHWRHQRPQIGSANDPHGLVLRRATASVASVQYVLSSKNDPRQGSHRDRHESRHPGRRPKTTSRERSKCE
jgi:predicted permease